MSRYGVFELAPTLDHVGPMARSAADAGAMLGAIAGSDPSDPTAVLDPVPDYLAGLGQSVRGLRIGVDAGWNSDGVDAATQAVLSEATEAFRTLGADIVDVRFPDVTQAIADWFPNCAVEAAVAHEATYPARKGEYGPVLASVIEAGRALSGSDYQKILLRRLELRGGVAALFGHDRPAADPRASVPAADARHDTDAGRAAGDGARLLRYTCPFDMTGNPTITLPGGFSDAGMPIAFQLVAAYLDEATLVRAGAAFQSVTSWHRRHPVA